MIRKKSTKTKTVSEKISEILTRNANGQENSSDDEHGEEPRVEDEFDEYEFPDARSSDIRKRTVKLLAEQSAKYRGKITTRNELEDEEESDSSEGEEVNEEEYADSVDDYEGALKSFKNKLNAEKKSKEKVLATEEDSEADYEYSAKSNSASEDSDVSDSDNDGGVDDEEGKEEENDDDDYDDDDDEEDIESNDENSGTEHADGNDIIAETNRQAEVQKGQCVQNQLQIWERLLEMRIRTQKVLSKSNQLPAPEILKAEQAQNEKLASVCQESANSVSKLLTTLLQLQNACSEQYSEQRAALKKSLKRTLPTADSSTIPLKRYAEHLDAHFQEFKPYRNTVLLKWDDRTKLLTPGAGVKKKSLNEDYDIIRKIENTLQTRATLIKRSQTVQAADDKSAAAEDAHTANDDDDDDDETPAPAHILNAELYDDSDFYHQQLRELIEYKTSTSVSASEVTQQYVELQKLRQKMKKKVDTRASKGRKLRYTVHNKLINFMAPDDTTTWTEESKDELYRSLFA